MAWKPDYASLVEMRNYAGITHLNDDEELAFAITAASRAIDRATNRQFGKVDTPELRKYTPRFDRRRNTWIIVVDDLMDDTGLTITTEDGGTIDSYFLEPINAAQVNAPWTQIVVKRDSSVQPTGQDHEVSAVAPWGWTSTPVPIKKATLLQGNRFHARRTSPFGVAGSPDMGAELRLLEKVDPDVKVSLGPYIRWWAAA